MDAREERLSWRPERGASNIVSSAYNVLAKYLYDCTLYTTLLILLLGSDALIDDKTTHNLDS